MPIFGHSKFLPVFLYQKCLNKFRMCIFCHSEFIPVLLAKIVKKIQNGHFWPFKICSSLLGKNYWKKICNGHFWPFQTVQVFLGKIVGKNSEQPFLAILNLYQSFWEKLLEKIWNGHFFGHSKFIPVLLVKNCWNKLRMAIFGHFEFIPVFLGKIVGKTSEWSFLAILNFF